MSNIQTTLVPGGEWTVEIGRIVPNRGEVAGVGPTWHAIQAHVLTKGRLSSISDAILVIRSVDVFGLLNEATS